MAINVTDLNNRCVTTSTVGYMALALTGWMLSMTAAGWYDRFYVAGTALMLPFSLRSYHKLARQAEERRAAAETVDP